MHCSKRSSLFDHLTSVGGGRALDGIAKYVRGSEITAQLLRRGRERRQFVDVARVVLDDYRRLGIRRDLLEALERRDRLCAIIVEPRHAVRVVILAEVGCIAGDDHGARLRQFDEKAVMAGRMPRRVEHDYAAVAEYVLVVHEQLDLVLALGPTLERLVVYALGRIGARDLIPVALANQQQRLRKRRDLARVIGMIVTDSHISNLIGLEVELRELINDAHLRRDIWRGHGVTVSHKR